jgi:AraC family transcriptional regulator
MTGGCAPGESGVSVFRMQFRNGVYFSATPQQHLIWFQLTGVHIECRRAGRIIEQDAPAGSLAICPAGADCGAEADDSLGVLLVAIEPGRFSVAAAEDASLDAQLVERLSGQDHALLGLAHSLALEAASNYPNGPLFWNDVASGFVDDLVARHSSECRGHARGMLGKDVLARVRDYVIAHLGEQVEVAVLAKIADRSPFLASSRGPSA